MNYEKTVKKLWGEEAWIVNEALYCAKDLTLISGYQCSLHYHLLKTESFAVVSGQVGLEIGPRACTEGPTQILHLTSKSKPVRIDPETPHRFWAEGNDWAEILEISTHHSDFDVVRIEESRAR